MFAPVSNFFSSFRLNSSATATATAASVPQEDIAVKATRLGWSGASDPSGDSSSYLENLRNCIYSVKELLVPPDAYFMGVKLANDSDYDNVLATMQRGGVNQFFEQFFITVLHEIEELSEPQIQAQARLLAVFRNESADTIYPSIESMMNGLKTRMHAAGVTINDAEAINNFKQFLGFMVVGAVLNNDIPTTQLILERAKNVAPQILESLYYADHMVIDVAISNKNSQMMQLLCQHGADIDAAMTKHKDNPQALAQLQAISNSIKLESDEFALQRSRLYNHETNPQGDMIVFP